MIKKLSYIVIILYVFLIFPYQAYSDTANDIKKQIQNINDQRSAIDKEIETLSKQIAKTAEERNILANMIKELNLTRSKLLKEKQQIEKKITIAGLTINNLSSGIKNKEESINTSKTLLAKMINSLNQNENIPFVEKLLSVKTFTDFSNEYNNIISLNEKIKKNIKDLSIQKSDLELSKNQKEQEKNNLNNLRVNLTEKEQAVSATKKEKDSLLIATKNKETEYQKMLNEKIKKRDAFEKELGEYESQLKFILNPKSLPKQGSAVLSWPLDYVLITSLFGERWGRTHTGLDFRASVGTSVKSVAGGEVIGTGDTDIACKNASFGKWVLIKHNNGLSTVYAHLSLIKVKKGQKVELGEIIGLSGNTGSSTAPHLHLGVYASLGLKIDNVPSKTCNGKTFVQPMAATNAYLNPLFYLPRATKSMYKEGVL